MPTNHDETLIEHYQREAESWYQQAQNRADDALQFVAERDQLRALLRDLIRTTAAHHQSPNDLPIQAAYVAARDAALKALAGNAEQRGDSDV